MNPPPGYLEEALADNRRLQEQVDRLRAQVRALEDVARVADTIAHDFNSLVAGIVGYSELLLQRLDVGHPLRAVVEGVREAAGRGLTLAQQLGAAYRREGVTPSLVNPNDVVGAALTGLRRLVGEEIEVGATLEPTVGLVRVDPRQLEQVLATIVVSARDTIPREGRVIIRTANVDVREGAAMAGPRFLTAGHYVLLAVTHGEAGTGHEPASDPPQEGRGTSRAARGLGLSIAYDIVRRAGGDVRVRGVAGGRASFEVYLPRQEAPGPATAAGLPVPPGGPTTILLVEDEREVRDLVRDVLELEGYQVLVAEEGDAALRVDAGHAGRIDLLISDVVLPGISGPALVDKLQTTRPGLRTLLVSGYSDLVADDPQFTGPGRAFLRKPFAIETLVEIVGRLLGGPPPVR